MLVQMFDSIVGAVDGAVKLEISSTTKTVVDQVPMTELHLSSVPSGEGTWGQKNLDARKLVARSKESVFDKQSGATKAVVRARDVVHILEQVTNILACCCFQQFAVQMQKVKPERKYQAWALELAAKELEAAEEASMELVKEEAQAGNLGAREQRALEMRTRKAKHELRLATEKVGQGMTCIANELIGRLWVVWVAWESGTLRVCVTRWLEQARKSKQILSLRVEGENKLDSVELAQGAKVALAEATCIKQAQKKLDEALETASTSFSKVTLSSMAVASIKLVGVSRLGSVLAASRGVR